MVITRFAPSPTGYLHIGGARTALFSWLYAKHHGGQSILRIEDTDQSRSTQDYSQAIVNGLAWLGLTYDKGPFYQTQRFHHYQEAMEALLASGNAYRCYCSKERLDTLRNDQMSRQEKPRYDGHCRGKTVKTPPTASFVIRFKNPTDGNVSFHDKVYGEISVHNGELDDFIIARSDGVPTYNFTSVVDDLDMKVTHIIRGNDHINNTFRQINLIKALQHTPPHYTHLPMLLGKDGKRLSKRHGAQNLLAYRQAGYLPSALLNYLVRLGWSYGDQEIFSLESMIEHFSLSRISKSAARLNEEKLLWLNQHYLTHTPPEQLTEEVLWHAKALNTTVSTTPALTDVIALHQSRVKTVDQLARQLHYFYHEVDQYDQAAFDKHINDSLLPPLRAIQTHLSELADWKADIIHQAITDTALQFQLKMGQIAQPIRLAITGSTVSPPLGKTLELIGQTTTVERLKRLIDKISESSPS